MDEAKTISDLAVAAVEFRVVNGVPVAVLPEGYKAEGLEYLLPGPVRKAGTVRLDDALSFTAYVNLHKGSGTRVFAELTKTQFTAVLDDHVEGGGPAGWRKHRAIYACPKSEEWKTWTGSNKRQMEQEEFAQFLEDNLPDIIEPAGAEILTVAQNLEATTKVKFGSSTRLSDGQKQLVYEETIDGSAAKGTMKIPEAFVIGIPPFLGSDRYKLVARLRYRIPKDGGSLRLWYDLHRPEKVVDAVFNDELKRISTGWPAPADQSKDAAPEGIGLPILMGSPE